MVKAVEVTAVGDSQQRIFPARIESGDSTDLSFNAVARLNRSTFVRQGLHRPPTRRRVRRPIVDVDAAYPSWLIQRRGTVNDASCLNRTDVYGVVRPSTEDEVRTARPSHVSTSWRCPSPGPGTAWVARRRRPER